MLAPAVDAVARDQALQRYAGVYVAHENDDGADTNSTMNGNATAMVGGGGLTNATTNTLRLEVDDRPGLHVAQLDVRGVMQQARFRALGVGRNLPTPAWRLYPAGQRSSPSSAAAHDGSKRRGNGTATPPGGGGGAVYREGFRALLGDETPGKTHYAGRDLCTGS